MLNEIKFNKTKTDLNCFFFLRPAALTVGRGSFDEGRALHTGGWRFRRARVRFRRFLTLLGRLHAAGEVFGPVGLLTRVVTVTRVPAAVVDCLLRTVGTLQIKQGYFRKDGRQYFI